MVFAVSLPLPSCGFHAAAWRPLLDALGFQTSRWAMRYPLNAARCPLLPSVHHFYFWLLRAAGPQPTFTFSAVGLSGRLMDHQMASVRHSKLREPFRVYVTPYLSREIVGRGSRPHRAIPTAL